MKTTIEAEGQPFIDEPVFKDVPIYCATKPIVHRQLTGYDRVKLNWKKPIFGKKGDFRRLKAKSRQCCGHIHGGQAGGYCADCPDLRLLNK